MSACSFVYLHVCMCVCVYVGNCVCVRVLHVCAYVCHTCRETFVYVCVRVHVLLCV